VCAGADGAGDAVVRLDRHAPERSRVERHARGHAHERRVRRRERTLGETVLPQCALGGEAAAARPRPREDAARGGVDHVAERVDGGERRDTAPAGELLGGESDSAAARPLDAEDLPDHRAAAGADGAGLGIGAARRVARRASHRLVGKRPGVAHREVEEHGAGDDRHARRADGVAHAPVAQPEGHAGRRGEPERAAAGEDDRVDLGDEVAGREDAGLARAGRAAADVDGADGPGGREDHGAPGAADGVRAVADAISGGEHRGGS
jgi:hypothetical protein